MLQTPDFRAIPGPRRVVLLLLIAMLSGPGFAAALSAGEAVRQATIPLSSGPSFRVEAPEAHILRVWLKPSGEFTRQPSLAMEEAPSTLVPLTIEGGTVRTGAMQVRIDTKTGKFGVFTQDGTPLISEAEITLSTTGAWTLAYSLARDERLFGLGQDNQNNGRLDRRGVVRDLWAGQKINSGNVTAQYPVPLLIGTGRGRTYGIFFDNVHRLRFDLGKTKSDVMRCDSDGGEIDMYVIDGPHIADVVERYTSLTGRPSLPPLWALGYWQSKCTYYDWKPLDEAYQQLTSRGFPVDVMVIDADWPEIMTNYEWSKRWYPEGRTPADKIAEYAKKGVRIVMSQSGPMVRQESPTFKTGWDMGVFATDGKGNPVECGWYGGKLLDFTSPKMNDWLWPQTRKLNEEGVAGWWLDLDEPEGEPPQTKYFAGPPAGIHNQFSLLCTRSFEGVQKAVHPGQRPFVLSRAASAGSQRYHAAVWTGDVYSDYATLRAHAPEMLNSGLSGLAWWTSDTGGFLVGDYKNDRFGAHARLYERWMQFSSFCPITRAHKAGGPPEPYALGPTTEQGTKHYLQQRYRLLPYIYSYAWEASRKGLPLVRPLALEFPDDAGSVATPGDEYFFGSELLVAPVLYEGLTNRAVYFPPGKWIDWDEGYEYEGGRSWVVSAPQNRIPVAVRAGAIIPMAPDMKNTSEKPWDPITLEVFPRGTSRFTLYSDDGVTFAYSTGAFTVTEIRSEEDAAHVRLTIEESNKLFTPKQYRARLHLNSTPVAVTGAVDWSWDASARVLAAALPVDQAARHEMNVALGAALPARIAPELTAQKIDPEAEAAGSAGRPVPNFYPPPMMPTRVKAVNYDKGGEGVAFHSVRPLPEKGLYREDAFNMAPTGDAGGGYVLSGLRPEEWLHYTIDGMNGGYFDFAARAASARGGGRLRLVSQGQTIVTVTVPATGGDEVFTDIAVPSLYLNPGETTMLVYIDSGGFSLNGFDFRTAQHPPSVYYSGLALRKGVTELAVRDDGREPGYVRNLGREGSGLTFGLDGGAGGPRTLRLHYSNDRKKPIAVSVTVGKGPAADLEIPITEGKWTTLDIPVTLEAGVNRVSIDGREKEWDMAQADELEVLTP